MEINIIDDKKNPLFSRRELVCMVTKQGTTPSKKDIRTELSNELKLKPECVFIDTVYQKYGRHQSEVHVKVYDKPELVPGYEPSKKEEAKKPQDSGSSAAEVKEAPVEAKTEESKSTDEKKE
ncbi:MAG: hypothetical protein ABIG84_03705 [archaeon]